MHNRMASYVSQELIFSWTIVFPCFCVCWSPSLILQRCKLRGLTLLDSYSFVCRERCVRLLNMTPIVMIWLKNVVLVWHSLCCKFRTCLCLNLRVVHTVYICSYIYAKTSQSIASALSLTCHSVCVMYRLHNDPTPLARSYGLYCRLFSLMTLLYIIYVFCSLSSYAPFPAVYSYLSLPFTSLMSLIIPCSSTRDLSPHLVLFVSPGN